jgi:NAD(P)-dependent dehydrogenase (short-subunit alcohol dehydrogenase family)
MGRLDKKTAVVTGAASGIGLGIASAFVKEGARVLIADIDTQAGTAAAERLGPFASFMKLDVTCEASWAGLQPKVHEHLGELDILVNNAGVSLNGTIEEMRIDAWQRALAINCTGVLLGCQNAIALMRTGGRGGSIVNIASAAGIKVTSYAFAYGSTKAAVMYMTRGVALHCCEQKNGIRCNIINPGVVDTPIHDQVYELMGGKDATWAMYLKITPMGIRAQPADIAHAAVYLASDESRYVTGTAIEVDGGLAIS